jgi:DNA-directed RNA polymerase specialized sigma24 family protein
MIRARRRNSRNQVLSGFGARWKLAMDTVDSLPDDYRTVVILVEINGHSYAEIADLLGVPIGTGRSRLSRARSLLQRALWTQAQAAGLPTGTRHEMRLHG